MRNRSHKSTMHTGYLHKDFQQQYKVSCRPNRVISVRQYSGYTSNRQTSGKIGRSEKQSKEKNRQRKSQQTEKHRFSKKSIVRKPKNTDFIETVFQRFLFSASGVFVCYFLQIHTHHIYILLYSFSRKSQAKVISQERSKQKVEKTLSQILLLLSIFATLLRLLFNKPIWVNIIHCAAAEKKIRTSKAVRNSHVHTYLFGSEQTH